VLPAARRRRSTCMNLRPLRVVLLVIPPVRELDLVGIVDVFATANAFLPSDRHYHLELVTSNAHGTIQGMCGLQFAGAGHYSTLEGEIDTLLVPGVQPEKVQLSRGFDHGRANAVGWGRFVRGPTSWLKLAFLMVNERRLTGRS